MVLGFVHTVWCGFDGILTVRFCAVFGCSTSYGAIWCCDISYSAVRCGFQMNSTVRFGNVLSPTVRFSAVFQNRKTHGAVRCDLKRAKILRCGLVRLTARNRTDRKNRTVKNPANFLKQNLRKYPGLPCADSGGPARSWAGPGRPGRKVLI